jgi:uncharacterized protein YjbI with pentapeptide repeats
MRDVIFSKKNKLINAMQLQLEQYENQASHYVKTINELQEQLTKEHQQAVALEEDLKSKESNYLYYNSNRQTTLFKQILYRDRDSNQPLQLEYLSCPDLYLADRHPMIYEIVHTIVIENVKFRHSYFIDACFDTIIFKDVTFDHVCFYKSHFEDIFFINCQFIDSDFTDTYGYQLQFKNCSFKNTDIQTIKFNSSENKTILIEDCTFS